MFSFREFVMNAHKVMTHLVQQLEPVKKAINNLAIHVAQQLEPVGKVVNELEKKLNPLALVVQKGSTEFLVRWSSVLKVLANPQVQETLFTLVEVGKTLEREGFKGMGQFMGWGEGSLQYTIAELFDEGRTRKIENLNINAIFTKIALMCGLKLKNNEDLMSLVKISVYGLPFNFFSSSESDAILELRERLNEISRCRYAEKKYMERFIFLENYEKKSLQEAAVGEAKSELIFFINRLNDTLNEKEKIKLKDTLSFIVNKSFNGIKFEKRIYEKHKKRLQRFQLKYPLLFDISSYSFS